MRGAGRVGTFLKGGRRDSQRGLKGLAEMALAFIVFPNEMRTHRERGSRIGYLWREGQSSVGEKGDGGTGRAGSM